MAKAKKSKSGGKSKKHKHAGKGKKGKSKGKGKKHRSDRKEKDELENQEEKTGSIGSKRKAGGKGKKKKLGSKGKKGKSKGKGSKHKSGSKGKKSEHGSRGKKHKPRSKGKKGKHGSKGKKGKHGGKGKQDKPGGKEKKESKDGILSVKKSSTPDRASSSALSRASAASSESLIRPLNRKPFSPLVLPADRQLTTVRRPTTIYIWNWDNVWFFPTGVVAVFLVVLGMILMSLNVQEADELQAEEAMNGTYARNVTTADGVVASRSRWSRTDYSEATSPETFTTRRRRERAKNPNSPNPSFPGHMSTSETWFDSTGSSGDGDSAVVIVRGEAEEYLLEFDSTHVNDAKTQAPLLDAPIKSSQGNESNDIVISDSRGDIKRR